MGRPATTQLEVLSLMARYGVLSTLTLKKLISARIGSTWIRELMNSLEKSGLIVKAAPFVEGQPIQYWLLPDNADARNKISEKCKVPLIEFRNKRLRYSHYPHENIVSLFQASVERQMPSIQTIREATYKMRDLPEHLISNEIKENGYMPDLCLGVPTAESISKPKPDQTLRWLAVEIDRTSRSPIRIVKRLNIYARHTGFSGLIYLMPDERGVASVLDAFKALESIRLQGFSNSFLAVSVAPRDLFQVNDFKLNVGSKILSLCEYLGLVSFSESRNRDHIVERFSCRTQENSSNFAQAANY